MTGVDESLVTPAVVGLLRAELSFPVGSGLIPSPTLPATRLSVETGWAVLTVVPIGAAYEGDGWAGQPGSVERIRYQVSTTGMSQNHASLLAQEALAVVVDRVDGVFVNALTVPGHVVMNRRPAGRVLDYPGKDSFSSGRLFELLVHASG